MTARPLTDRFQRRITYLRLSVTDRCNLRCAYCMPEHMTFLPKSEVLSLEELHRIALAFIARGVRHIRLTGGEPLVRRDMMDLLRALGRHLGDGLDELTLTTNGTLLARHAQDLVEAGVRRVNVSLDTRNRDLFARLARKDALDAVLDGIAAAKAAGLAVKINTVALKGQNEVELPDLIAWAHGEGHSITLIETMPLGEVEEERVDQFLPLDRVRERLKSLWTMIPSVHRTGGPARYYEITETGGTLGLITPMTGNFCDGCNRMRVTTAGQIYPCLGGTEAIDLRATLRAEDDGAALARAIDEAVAIKPERHAFAIEPRARKAGLARHMSVTGG